MDHKTENGKEDENKLGRGEGIRQKKDKKTKKKKKEVDKVEKKMDKKGGGRRGGGGGEKMKKKKMMIMEIKKLEIIIKMTIRKVMTMMKVKRLGKWLLKNPMKIHSPPVKRKLLVKARNMKKCSYIGTESWRRDRRI